MKPEITNGDLASLLVNETDESLEEALSRIHERYGNDFQAFFRDAYKEAALRCEEPDDSSPLMDHVL